MFNQVAAKFRSTLINVSNKFIYLPLKKKIMVVLAIDLFMIVVVGGGIGFAIGHKVGSDDAVKYYNNSVEAGYSMGRIGKSCEDLRAAAEAAQTTERWGDLCERFKDAAKIKN